MKGIGVEAINVLEFKGDVDRCGDAVLLEMFTESERESCWLSRRSIATFAGLKAAKEALLKALPSMARELNFSWLDLEVEFFESGRPQFRIAGRLLEYLRRVGINTVHLSVSSTTESAVAFVIVE
jgi:holo-[acyl-carrier protein] synthase